MERKGSELSKRGAKFADKRPIVQLLRGGGNSLSVEFPGSVPNEAEFREKPNSDCHKSRVARVCRPSLKRAVRSYRTLLFRAQPACFAHLGAFLPPIAFRVSLPQHRVCQ